MLITVDGPNGQLCIRSGQAGGIGWYISTPEGFKLAHGFLTGEDALTEAMKRVGLHGEEAPPSYPVIAGVRDIVRRYKQPLDEHALKFLGGDVVDYIEGKERAAMYDDGWTDSERIQRYRAQREIAEKADQGLLDDMERARNRQ